MSSESPTFTEEVASNMLKELQSWWEVPSMAQYISLFREAFHLPEIEIEELENGLIDDTVKGPNEWLQNLNVAFLKSIMPGRVNPTNWETHLTRLVKRKWSEGPYSHKENPFAEEIPFHQLSLRSKVEIIYSFCLYRLDNNDITEAMKAMDAEALRVQKLGFDDAGSTYWYFYGSRLYKEEALEEKKTWNEEWDEQKRKSLTKKRGRGRPPKKQNIENDIDTSRDEKFMNVNGKSRWSVVCDTLEEWVNFAEKFKNSKSKNEKSLFTIIKDSFLPTLNNIYEEKERKLQQKIKELLPMREKIVTRRETRRLRGDSVGDINYALLNGYDSDEDYSALNSSYHTPVVKDRAQRLEERNKRANEAQQTPSSSKRVKRNAETEESTQNASDNSENNELDVMSQMIKLLSSVKLHKDAWPFLYPVSEEDAPGYREIIKDPVDLSTIENRLYKGDYETIGDLDEDFSKMVTNCELYNGENHPFSRMAQTLRILFRKEIASLLEKLETIESSNADSEESNDSQYHSSSNSNSSSPPHESSIIESKEHKKVKGKKKKKKPNMEALDMLAQASDIAVQDDFASSSSPTQKKSPVPQEIRPAPYNVPSVNMPCNTASPSNPSTNKTSIPVSSPSFIPVNSSPQPVEKTKPVIVRAKASNTAKRSSPIENVATTSLNAASSINNVNTVQQNNAIQSYAPKTVPVILAAPSPNQSELRVQNNPMTTMQSNVCMSNGLPVMQQVVIPAGTQVPNSGQYVFASPQNTFRILTKEQSVQLQNNVGQLNQGFLKVVPQIITSSPVMQVSKDGVQSLQFQTLSPNSTQTFTQVAQNPQFVSLPYVVTNQNSITNSSPTAMNFQSFQMPPRQMQINGEGDG